MTYYCRNTSDISETSPHELVKTMIIHNKSGQRSDCVMHDISFLKASCAHAQDLSDSEKERPEAGKDELFLKDPAHLLEHEPLDFAHVLQDLLPVLLAADLAVDPDLLQQATDPSPR